MTTSSFTRSSPYDLVRVGVIAGAGGHTHSIWGNTMNPPAGHLRTTGMVLTHAWTIRPDMAERLHHHSKVWRLCSILLT